MTLAYVDTSFWYALVDLGDPGQAQAADAYREYAGELCSTTSVFAEVLSLVTKRVNKATAIELGEAIREAPRVRLLHPTSEDFERAWELFSSRRDLSFDLVDALSFTVMSRLGISVALALDRHFSQMGFEVLPR